MQRDRLFPKKGFSAISVYGLGVSNTPCLRFLLSRGFSVTVFDDKPLSALPSAVSETLHRLQEEGYPLVFCDALPKDGFPGDLVLRAPGIRPTKDAFLAARRRGVPILTEAGLFLQNAPIPVLAVTGSDGKSTTATLLSAMLRHAGRRVYFGGNIGTPLLPLLSEMEAAEDALAVMELSSFQLYDAPVSPVGALLTNLSENHLNWHKDYAEYAAAKARIFRTARRTVLSADDAGSRPFIRALTEADVPPALFSLESSRDSLLSRYGLVETAVLEGEDAVHYDRNGKRTPLFKESTLRLVGRHNLCNMLAASLFAFPYVTGDAIQRTAEAETGLHHRMELICRANGVDFVNSSVDTSPSRTAATLRAVKPPVLWLGGGAAKGVSFQPLSPLLADTARAVFLSGATAAPIAHALASSPVFSQKGIPVFRFASLKEATDAAVRYAEKGDTVLLSPASTSFDAFQNFEERGNAFASYVREALDSNASKADKK